MNHRKKSPIVALGLLTLLAACGENGSVSAPLSVEGHPGVAPNEPLVGAAAPADPPAAAPADAGVADPPGCSSVLTPPMHPTIPVELISTGFWQRCGAYGSGGAKVVRVAANGLRAVVITGSGDAFVLALPGLERLGAFEHGTGRVGYAALSPDGRTLATFDERVGEVALWDVDTHALLRVINRKPSWPAYTAGTADLVFSSDGSRLAVADADSLEVWDVAINWPPEPISFRSDIGPVNRLAFVAGDTRLAMVTYGFFGNGPYLGGVRVDVVDADTGDNRITLPAQYAVAVPLMAASKDGSTIAVSTEGQGLGVHFFAAASGAEIATSSVIYGDVLGLSEDGTRVAVLAGQLRNQVEVRQVADGTLLSQTTAPNFYDMGMGSQRGPIEVTADLQAALFGDIPPVAVTMKTLADGTLTGSACGTGHAGAVMRLTRSADGTRLVTGNDDFYGSDLVWDAASGAPVAEPPPADATGMDPYSPDGRSVAVPRGDAFFQVKNRLSGSPVGLYGPHITRVRALDWSADGAFIVSVADRDPVDRGGNPPLADVWSASSQRQMGSLPSTDGPALFATTGHTLYIAGEGSVTAWCYQFDGP